jgi:hypothetical protein
MPVARRHRRNEEEANDLSLGGGDVHDDDDNGYYPSRNNKRINKTIVEAAGFNGVGGIGPSGWSNTATLHTPQQTFDSGIGFTAGTPSSNASGEFGVPHSKFAGDGGMGDDHDNGVITNAVAVKEEDPKAYREFQLMRDTLHFNKRDIMHGDPSLNGVHQIYSIPALSRELAKSSRSDHYARICNLLKEWTLCGKLKALDAPAGEASADGDKVATFEIFGESYNQPNIWGAFEDAYWMNTRLFLQFRWMKCTTNEHDDINNKKKKGKDCCHYRWKIYPFASRDRRLGTTMETHTADNWNKDDKDNHECRPGKSLYVGLTTSILGGDPLLTPEQMVDNMNPDEIVNEPAAIVTLVNQLPRLKIGMKMGRKRTFVHALRDFFNRAHKREQAHMNDFNEWNPGQVSGGSGRKTGGRGRGRFESDSDDDAAASYSLSGLGVPMPTRSASHARDTASSPRSLNLGGRGASVDGGAGSLRLSPGLRPSVPTASPPPTTTTTSSGGGGGSSSSLHPAGNRDAKYVGPTSSSGASSNPLLNMYSNYVPTLSTNAHPGQQTQPITRSPSKPSQPKRTAASTSSTAQRSTSSTLTVPTTSKATAKK